MVIAFRFFVNNKTMFRHRDHYPVTPQVWEMAPKVVIGGLAVYRIAFLALLCICIVYWLAVNKI